MIEPPKYTGALDRKNVRWLFHHAQACRITSGIGANDTLIELGKESALYARANSQNRLRDRLRNFRCARILFLNDPEGYTLRAPGAYARHSP
jgi:hypothetical protein